MNNSMLKKLLITGIVILFIFTSIGSSASYVINNPKESVTFDGNIFYVGGTGPNNYTSIQGAIDVAIDGDTIFVYDDSSPYNENIVIDSSLTIIGKDRNTTIIDGGVKTDDDGILFTGFTVDGAVNINSDNNQIIDNIIQNSHKGVIIEYKGSNNLIKGNRIVHHTYGVYLRDNGDCINNLFTENFIAHNKYTGIFDDDRDGGTIATWNVIADNGWREGYTQFNKGIFKHDSSSIYHHNDLFFNRGNAYVDCARIASQWDDGSEGNYWDDWQWNQGYPTHYVITIYWEEDIDWHPSSTPYIDSIVLSLYDEYNGDIGEPITFYSRKNINPNDFNWFWDFGDGNTSTEITPEHAYEKSGIYPVTAKITNDEGRYDLAKSRAVVGRPPNPPTIDGPRSGSIYETYNYTFVATDPDGDDLIYHVWWGEMMMEEAGPYPSGEEIILSYNWYNAGTYYIEAYVEDTIGLLSEPTYFEVTMPRAKTVSSLFLRLLERFPNAFPILRQLLGI